MTRAEIEQEIRNRNPSSRLDDGTVVTTGNAAYEDLITRWTDAAVAQQDERAEQVAQEDEETNARAVYRALKDGTGTQAERFRRAELVCAALVRRNFGK